MQVVEDFVRDVARGFENQDRPLVTLTYAQSLDGSIAQLRGTPLRLSGPASLKMTHRLRAMHDGILVGIGTLLSDDPKLTVRQGPGEHPQPIILDSRLRIPGDAKVLKNQKRPWLFSGTSADPPKQKKLEDLGCKVFQVDTSGEEGHLHLPEILQTLRASGVKRLMVEGGASVIGSFLSSGLVDLVVLTIAPLFVGGLKAVENPITASNTEPGFPKLSPAFVKKVGDDIVVWGHFSPS